MKTGADEEGIDEEAETTKSADEERRRRAPTKS
jgi:hypothetical protein